MIDNWLETCDLDSEEEVLPHKEPCWSDLMMGMAGQRTTDSPTAEEQKYEEVMRLAEKRDYFVARRARLKREGGAAAEALRAQAAVRHQRRKAKSRSRLDLARVEKGERTCT